MINVCFIYGFLFLLVSMVLFILSLIFMLTTMTYFIELELFNLNSNLILATILVDWMSILFMSFVLFISSMVIFYSYEYMSGDLNLNRFILLVVMFVLSMMFLIISPNLISILLGWDGLGLVSYCLVIYYQNIKSFNAGMITALTNRVGDAALLIAIAWMMNYGSWNFIFYLDMMKNSSLMNIITFLVVLAAITKSAQIPFSSWLPAAMAAPTPVSSLVHSSTLVTAGVYLLIRFSGSINQSLLMFLLFISCMTMFMAGLGANFEFDLKKIIALSTLSQLGLMMSILALGNSNLAFFHLLTHALFKALLFMCAGSLIHSLINCQDIRFMGGIYKSMPLTCVFMNISNLSLCGLPFLSGFYSKDLIVECMSMNYLNFFVYLIFYVSIGLTVCYSVRLTYYTNFGNFNFISLNLLTEKSYIMLMGMGGLIFLVVVMGSVLSWLMFMSICVVILPFYLKIMTLMVILLGLWMGFEISKFSVSYSSFSKKLLGWSYFLALMWNLPYLSTFGINYNFIKLGSVYYLNMDQGWSEFYGSQKMYLFLMKNSISMQNLFLNNLKIYFVLFILWIMLLFYL
uniref:NADH dehydrogenase subunit 5 n=1 Tax=Metoecus javanus TaxID=2873716 RepID=UPI001FF48C1D|nr:NADH dehydrogenase subunit 5 [Metoecus javanus]UOI84448.1 NADH dehydrogenase subunit 5 [Metoecus javanus]